MKKLIIFVSLFLCSLTGFSQPNGYFQSVRFVPGKDTATFSPQPNGTILFANNAKLYLKTATNWQLINTGNPTPGGSVSSVGFSPGASGLTVSGTPITSAGTITISGGVLTPAFGGLGNAGGTPSTGDILYGNTSTWNRLAAGTNGQTLTLSGGLPSWQTPTAGTVTSIDVSGGSSGLTFSGGPITSSGSISLASGILTPIFGGIGGAGGSAPTSGDLIVGSSGDFVRLGIGTNGQVLGVSGGAVGWVSGGGGGWALTGTNTFTGNVSTAGNFTMNFGNDGLIVTGVNSSTLSTIQSKTTTSASNIFLQTWENKSGDHRMSFGDISTSNAGPALKINGLARSQDVELALVQSTTQNARDYGGYFLVEGTSSTSDMNWYHRVNLVDTKIFGVKTSDLSFNIYNNKNLITTGQSNSQTFATNAGVSHNISNTNSGASASAFLQVTGNGSTGYFRQYSSGFAGYKTAGANSLFIWNQTAGDIDILADGSTGQVSLTAGGASTEGYLLGSKQQNTWNPQAQSGLGASAETVGYTYNAATYTSANGTTTTNRSHWFKGFTFAGTSGTHTTTNSYNGYFESNAAGTNGAITNNYAAGFDGNISLVTAGNGLYIKEGTNATMGTATANGTTEVTVNTTKVTANSRIFFACQSGCGTSSAYYVSSRTGGTSFGFKAIGADTGTVAWWFIEPTP